MARTFVRRHSVALLALLAVLLTFGVALLPVPPVAAQFAAAFVPALVAIALAVLVGGKAEAAALLSRLVRWRIKPGWLAIALGLALALRLAMTGAALLLGLIPAASLTWTSPMQWLLMAVMFLVAATPEELGWRGFALPRLLASHSPVASAVLLGLPWGVLHLVLHLPGMPNEGLPLLPTILQLVGLSIMLTWLFVRGGQSVVLAIIFHAAQSLFGIVNGGLALQDSHWLMAVVWTTAALLLLLDRAMWRRPAGIPSEPETQVLSVP